MLGMRAHSIVQRDGQRTAKIASRGTSVQSVQRSAAQHAQHILPEASHPVAEDHEVEHVVHRQERVEEKHQPLVCHAHEQRQRAAHRHRHQNQVMQTTDQQQGHRGLPRFPGARLPRPASSPTAYAAHPSPRVGGRDQAADDEQVEHCDNAGGYEPG